MTPKKQPVKEEPFLNTVARKLGHAAGTLTHVAQGLTENLSALPKAVSRKARPTATGRRSKKKTTRASRTRSAKGAATARKPTGNKSPRRVRAIHKGKK